MNIENPILVEFNDEELFNTIVQRPFVISSTYFLFV